MSNIRPQSCTLQVHGSQLVGPDTTFILVERAKPTPKKPLYYLLHVLPDGTRGYFSSCYPDTVQNTFRMEHGGVRYWLALNGPTATLTDSPPSPENGPSGQSPLNNNRTLLLSKQQTKGKPSGQNPAQ